MELGALVNDIYGKIVIIEYSERKLIQSNTIPVDTIGSPSSLQSLEIYFSIGILVFWKIFTNNPLT